MTFISQLQIVIFLSQFHVRRLLFGFMATTGFLSMWLSNTATAAMMLPIAQAVLKELGKCTDTHISSSTTPTEGEAMEGDVISVSYRRILPLSGSTGVKGVDPGSDQHNGPIADTAMLEEEEGEVVTIAESTTPVSPPDDSEQGGRAGQPTAREDASDATSPSMSQTVNRFGKGLMIGVAYAANIGGIATLTGTGPNLVLRGDVSKYVCGMCSECSLKEIIIIVVGTNCNLFCKNVDFCCPCQSTVCLHLSAA